MFTREQRPPSNQTEDTETQQCPYKLWNNSSLDKSLTAESGINGTYTIIFITEEKSMVLGNTSTLSMRAGSKVLDLAYN